MIEGLDIETTRLLMAELREGRLAKQLEAKKRAALIQKKRGEQLHGDLGVMRAMIPPASYHYWGQRLGYQCWDDPQFMREYLRDVPEARVQTRGRNPMVGYTGGRGTKFHKSYGELA